MLTFTRSAAQPDARHLRRESGLSMVELLIGVAIGLFIVGGATKLLVDHLTNNRLMLIESRVNQDLRAAADIVVRDLRRSGYWQGALTGVTDPPTLNGYRAATPTGAAATTVTYSYSRDAAGAENNAIDANENFGFDLQGGVLLARLGGGWQQLTDPNAIQVTTFTVTPVRRVVSLGTYCTPVCDAIANPTTCPSIVVRRFDVLIRGNAPAPNNNIVREIRESVRLRNDELPVAGCP